MSKKSKHVPFYRVDVVREDQESVSRFSRHSLERVLQYIGIDMEIAEVIAQDFKRGLRRKKNKVEKSHYRISSDFLCEWVRDEIIKHEESGSLDPSEELPEKYVFWRNFRNDPSPVVILIGGATGVGTSFIADSLDIKLSHITSASTHSYKRKVNDKLKVISTDDIRSALRGFITEIPMATDAPELWISSYGADHLYPGIEPGDARVFQTYESQANLVQAGLVADINEAVRRNCKGVIAEGIHVNAALADYVEAIFPDFSQYVLQYHIEVDDDTLIDRLETRQESLRGIERDYTGNSLLFILEIKQILRMQAEEAGIRVIENPDLDGADGHDPFDQASLAIMDDIYARLRFSERYDIRKTGSVAIDRL